MTAPPFSGSLLRWISRQRAMSCSGGLMPGGDRRAHFGRGNRKSKVVLHIDARRLPGASAVFFFNGSQTFGC